MASVTFAVDEKLKSRLEKFPWVNWSEVARENLLFKDSLEQIRGKLETKEEQEFVKWPVELGRKAKKGRFKRMLAGLSPGRRKELLDKMPLEKRGKFKS